MDEKLMNKLAAKEAWTAVQEAYELICEFEPEVTSEKDRKEAMELLEKASKWLTALKG